MTTHLEKRETLDFVRNYFRSKNIKGFIIYILLFFIFLKITGIYNRTILSFVIIIIIGIIKYSLIPDYLYRETREGVDKYYKDRKSNKEGLFIICNVKKWDGPMFGILNVNDNYIKFTPFKDNLKNEGFFVKLEDIKVNETTIIDFKYSIFNRLFFRDLSKGIIIPTEEAQICIQVPKTYEVYNWIQNSLKN
ncbi:hypothetical protein GOQ27_01120 [Clostridium sp. D2Q-11]|uniref:Uncharacterized protein n=1 Tax=Anaeromonas frigoriresistens TaxID=2683708 RepID=A0A942UUG2_9FIRM|nr:hypothetical protein [Anaeromonas frigoriresistens]MBS4537041.1 hypothetical protein [Anaeromonas frigoriresistens]